MCRELAKVQVRVWRIGRRNRSGHFPRSRLISNYEQIASHFGGTRQGLAISWPGQIDDPGGVRYQFHHVIDIVPTILEAVGIPAPELVNGIQQKPIDGVSMVYTFKTANGNAPSTRTTQYFEMIANRGIYHDGSYARRMSRGS
jgi:arylsulfatase